MMLMFLVHHRCKYSRLEPSYEFHFEGLSNFSASVKKVGSNPRRQSKNVETKYITHLKLVHELYMIHVSNRM
jgi:hypothetical protein